MHASERPRVRLGCGRHHGLPRSLLMVALTAAILALPSCGTRGIRQPVSHKPNVLLIVIDALRADRLHCYGYPRATSPALDTLAAQGVLFTDAMVEGAETLNSVPLLLTGRYPATPGMVWRRLQDKHFTLPGPGCPTLAELLKQAGYATGMISANPLLGADLGLERGFDAFDSSWGQESVWVQTSSSDVNQRAFAWLSRPRQGRPFFLYLHYLDPHSQYRPSPTFCVFGRPGYTAHDDVINVALNDVGEGFTTPRATDARLAREGLSRADVVRLSDLYDGEVLCTDHYLGRLFQKLRDLGLYDDTVIIVTADHGEAFLEHADVQHANSLYQEVIRAPLIIAGPQIHGGRRVDCLVESVDLAPTMLEAVGAAVPTGMSGRSFYGALARGENFANEIGLAEIPVTKSYAVREGKWKLISTPRGRELYDLARDPHERQNLASSRPQQMERLTRLLHKLLSERKGTKVSSRPLSERERKALESLGYLK